MKSLRVLTGIHAGANMPLVPGLYQITGSDVEDAVTLECKTLKLLDWTGKPIYLDVTPDGQVIFLGENKSSETSGSDVWLDMRVRQFGSVVLSVGSKNSDWPSDTEFLLQNPNLPNASWQPTRKKTPWSTGTEAIVMGVLVVISALFGHAGRAAPEASAPRIAKGYEMLSQSLSQLGLVEVEVHRDSGDVVLSGLVRDTDQARAVRTAVTAVEKSTGISVIQSWEVAEDVAETIEGALRTPGIFVRYSGEGRFTVEGTAVNTQNVFNSAHQLLNDLGKNVKGISVSVNKTENVMPFSVAIAADGFHYAERPDGAKVFSKNPLN